MNNIKVMDIPSSEAGVCNIHTADKVRQQFSKMRAKSDKYLHPCFTIIFFLFGLLLFATYRWITQSPPLPDVFIGLFLAGLIYALYHIHEYWDQLRFMYLGRKGEPETSLILEKYQSDNKAAVFCDVSIGRDAIDYIVTNKAGVFVIKIIKWHAPINTKATVWYNDEELLLNEYRPNVNPVIKQKSLANWLGYRLNIGGKHSVPVNSIIVLPGWFVQAPKEPASVRVINPRELERLFCKHKNVLSDEEKTLIDDQLGKMLSDTHRKHRLDR